MKDFNQFEGLICECCETERVQQLRCGQVTSWENLCRSCWNNHLTNVPRWLEDDGQS